MQHRTGRRIHVQAPYGELIHEIRLSSDGNVWRARVVTLPRQIWVAPGGATALTFEAGTSDEAEALAVEFVERECVARGYRLANNRRRGQGQTGGGQPAHRLCARYPIRFEQFGALERATGAGRHTGSTLNLSETGLFVATDEALYPGSRVALDIRLPGTQERLEGTVVWSRMSGAPGSQSGMGIRLDSPSLTYRARIQSLKKPATM